MKFSVVIPVFNAASTLNEVIAAWRSVNPLPEAIIVIDDGSIDGSAEIAERAGAKVVAFSTNRGRGAARAQGIEASDTPLVLMCDAALIPADDFPKRALAWLAEPKVAAAFAHIVQPNARTVVDRWRGRHLFKTAPPALNRRALLATGVCLLRREAVEKVGGFEASLRAGEDAELGRRLLAAGWEVVADPSLRATCLTRESAHALLARYARWNSPDGIRGGAWVRQWAYAVKTMAREDLQAGDPLAALLSLAAPLYQLRRR
jgi:glycosyltransferase involved in cell wall biosynthesis